MGTKRRVVPYFIVDEKRVLPFTDDLELASIFALAEARRGSAPLQAIARVYYPFHVLSWEGGVLLVDQLGLNHASIRYRVIPDVEDFKEAIGAVSDDTDAFREVLREKGDLFRGFAGESRIRIEGLIAQSGKSERLSELLENADDIESGDEPLVFNPVLNEREIESIIESIRSLRMDIKEDLRSLEEAKLSLMDALERSRKGQDAEIQGILGRGEEAKARMRKAFEEAKGRYRSAHKERLKEIREEYRKQVAPLIRERRRVKRRLSRLKEKLENSEARKESATEVPSKEVEEIEAKLREVEDAIKALRAWRDGEVEEARGRYKMDLKFEVGKMEREETRFQREIKEKKADVSEMEAAAKKVTARIDRLVRSKMNKLSSLSRLRFDVKAGTGGLHVPFYVFQYGGRRFDFYPPVVASSAKGILSRFRRMLAENLESKMTQLIKPRIGFVETYLRRAVKNLSSSRGRGRGLAVEYRRAGDELNLLRSREAVDKIMTGLVKIRREGWISDDEYIRLQGTLIENLPLISRP